MVRNVWETVETGAFIRKKYNIKGKRKYKTDKFVKNQKKYILGHIGDFEVYVYPYDYPDCVFIGKFPISTKIESSNQNQLISAFNRVRWFLNGCPYSEVKTSKGVQTARHSIRKAYNQGLKDKTSKEKPQFL